MFTLLQFSSDKVPISLSTWLSFFSTMTLTSLGANTLGGILLALVCGIAIFKIIVGYFI